MYARAVIVRLQLMHACQSLGSMMHSVDEGLLTRLASF